LPPVGVTVAEPFDPPKQEMFDEAEMVAVGEPAFGTMAAAVVVQPFWSVMVHV
jgi:hypothetical protein